MKCKGQTKPPKSQMPINTSLLALNHPFKPLPILNAPPLSEKTPTKDIWFTHASAERVNAR